MNDWQKLKKRKLEVPPSLSETTSNLQLPEVVGEKVDKRTLRKTGRTEQFATRVSLEWLEKVKGIAKKENLKLVEVLERMLESYEGGFSVNLREEVKVRFGSGVKEDAKNVCSFFGQDSKTQEFVDFCSRSLFDRKKQLCRSHNKQVWVRFNKFLKEKKLSVSGTATWLGIWDDSGDWKYFWDLANK